MSYTPRRFAPFPAPPPPELPPPENFGLSLDPQYAMCVAVTKEHIDPMQSTIRKLATLTTDNLTRLTDELQSLASVQKQESAVNDEREQRAVEFSHIVFNALNALSNENEQLRSRIDRLEEVLHRLVANSQLKI